MPLFFIGWPSWVIVAQTVWTPKTKVFTIWSLTDFIFSSPKITAEVDCSHEIKRPLLLGRKVMTNLDSIFKSRDITLSTKSSQGYDFSSSHVQMCELDHKEGWASKNWCFSIVLENTLESSLNCKEIKPVNPKGNQPWIFIGRTDAKADAPILWLTDAKSQLTGKDPDAGKDEGKRRKGSQRIRWLDSIINSMDMNLSKLWEIVEDRGAWDTAVHGVTKSQTWLTDWTTKNQIIKSRKWENWSDI